MIQYVDQCSRIVVVLSIILHNSVSSECGRNASVQFVFCVLICQFQVITVYFKSYLSI